MMVVVPFSTLPPIGIHPLQSNQRHMMVKFQAAPVNTVEAVVPATAISSTGRRPNLSEAQPGENDTVRNPRRGRRVGKETSAVGSRWNTGDAFQG